MLKFSVVMAVYIKDESKWFEQAIESLLYQTLVSDDIIIVVDGPLTDKLNNSLEKYESDKTVSIVRLDENQGLGNALNVGIARAKYDLIARMDSDDIAVVNRFEIQIAEFSRNPKLDILGGQIAEFVDDPEEVVSYRKVPTSNLSIRDFSRRRSPFNHPTVMYRKSVILKLGGYDSAAVRIEDYDLWLRAIHANATCGNVDSILLKYRSTADAMRRRKTIGSFKSHIRARARFFSKRYISFSDFCYGVITQTILFILPYRVANEVFKRFVRGEDEVA